MFVLTAFIKSFISAIQIYTEYIFVLKYSLIKLCHVLSKVLFHGLIFTHPDTLNGIQSPGDCIWVIHMSFFQQRFVKCVGDLVTMVIRMFIA